MSADAKETLSLEGGKLRDDSELAYFDVDPDTLQRSPSPSRTLTLVAKEIADQ
jgi:hypothetical protein